MDDSGIDIPLTFITPIIACIGFFLMIISFIILCNSEFKEVLYRYLRAEAVFVISHLFINSFRPVYDCASCSLSKTYFAQIYFIYFLVYGLGVCELAAFIYQILSAYSCYSLIKSRAKENSNTNFSSSLTCIIICIVVFLASFATFIYNIFEYDIKTNQTSTQTLYYSEFNEFGSSSSRKIIESVVICTRDILGILLMITINILLFVNVKRYVERKRLLSLTFNNKVLSEINVNCNNHNQNNQKLSSDQEKHGRKVETRTALMVMIACLNCLIGRLPISIFFIYRNLIAPDDSIEPFRSISELILRIGILCINISYCLKFFFYYFSNRKFRNIYKRYFAVFVGFFRKTKS